MASWSDVRRIALGLPGTSERTSSAGTLSWIAGTKGFAWERPLRAGDRAALGEDAPAGPILGIRTADLELKDVFLASDPDVFFTTPHFAGYPAVLIRLDKIGVKKLADVLYEAWLTRAPKRLVSAYLRGPDETPPSPRGRPKSGTLNRSRAR